MSLLTDPDDCLPSSDDEPLTPGGSPHKPRKLKCAMWWDSQLTNLSKRNEIAKWMKDFCVASNLTNDTAECCLSYVDRMFTSKKEFHHSVKATSKAYASVFACLLIASKREEKLTSQIGVDLLVAASDNSCTREEIMDREIKVLAELKWFLCAPDREQMLDQFLLCLDDDIKKDTPEFQNIIIETKKAIEMDREYFWKHSASRSVANHFYAAWLQAGNRWNSHLEKAFGYSEEIIKNGAVVTS